MKLAVLFFLIIITYASKIKFVAEERKNLCEKFNTKGKEIPRFCKRFFKPYNIVGPRAINYKITSNQAQSKKLNNNQLEKSINEDKINDNKAISFIYIFRCIIGIYLYFFILSILKCYEEIFKLKLDHINAKFCNLIDINYKITEGADIKEYEGQFIFISGNIFIEEYAKDKVFNNNNNLNNYIKIERKVEFYENEKNAWLPIDNNDNLNEILPEEISIGKSSLYGINLTDNQIKKFKKFEKIKLSQFNLEEMKLKLNSIIRKETHIV
jgi:hypothetical protein